MLRNKTAQKLGQIGLIILILFTYHKLTYGQSTSNLKIQNFNLRVKSPAGGICANVPGIYANNLNGGFFPGPDVFSIGNVKNSPFLTKGFETIPKDKYFRAKARTPQNINIEFTLPDSITGLGTNKVQLSGPVAAHLGYKTADGFVMKEKEPIFKKEFEMGVGGFGFGLNHQADHTFVFDKASTEAFMVFSFTVRYLDQSNQPVFIRDISVMMPFVVEGIVDQAVDSLGLVTEPQIPYMVLHDPPGDGSFTALDQAKTICRSLETSFANDESNNTNASLKLGYAGSVGVIVVVDIEVYVEFSGSLSIGDFKMQSKSNETCLTLSKAFSTAADNGFKDGGDLFVGYGYDVAYGVYRQIVVDDDSCKVRIEKNLVYRPIKTPESIREFALDESGILSEIERLQKDVDNTALPVKTRADAQNQIKVWNQVLELNEKNKNTASASLDPNISFSGGTGGFTRTKTLEVSETNTISVEHYIGVTAGLQGVVNIGGSGFSAGYEYATEKRFGKTTAQTNATANALAYTFVDANGGDKFNVDVFRDPMFGTPVFRLKEGTISSCPYEGGYQRDQPKLKHNDSNQVYIVSQGNPVGSSSTFKIDLCNESNETRTYNLALNAASNLNGAVISASGVPLNGNDAGQVYSIPANSCLQDLIIEVKQLSANSPLSYPNLELFLYSPCDEGIQSSVFASVYFGNATSVKDVIDDRALTVYPNPTSSILNIQLADEMSIHSILLMDAMGRMVDKINTHPTTSQWQMDVDHLATGMYTLQVQTADKTLVKKVMIQE
ncbi:MAG: T9SS type A sorting domain-containing protein [Saprospiraceae bacterium]|nr:T9SS type A sorting domain-containing protein [Saprospiraceae bacterium]